MEIEPLRSAFFARALGGRINGKDEDAWVSRIAKDVERNEDAVRPRCVTVL